MSTPQHDINGSFLQVLAPGNGPIYHCRGPQHEARVPQLGAVQQEGVAYCNKSAFVVLIPRVADVAGVGASVSGPWAEFSPG
jgi:hypothetical protein